MTTVHNARPPERQTSTQKNHKNPQYPKEGKKTCSETLPAATRTTMVTRSTGTRGTSRRAGPSTGTNVTLLSVLLFASTSPPPLASSWSAVAMLVIPSRPFLVFAGCWNLWERKRKIFGFFVVHYFSDFFFSWSACLLGNARRERERERVLQS